MKKVLINVSIFIGFIALTAFTTSNLQILKKMYTDLLKNGLTILLVFIAGFFTLYQIKANIISSARIRWIEDLRDTLSKLYSVTLNIVNSFECHIIASKYEDKVQSEKHYFDYTQNMATFNSLSNKARMQLNSKELEHKAIEEILEVIDKKIEGENIKLTTGNEIESYLREIVFQSKIIFKKEWDKSKKIFKI